MDELLRHCLQELAFDGDLGCNAFRLRDFVQDFYSSRSSMQQNLDDSYHAFVWTLISQHPSVRIGVVPNGQNVEVKIPPQPRVSKKGKGTQNDVQTESSSAASLETIPSANMRSLDELVREYGDRLRIAVDPEMCFVAVTGSHARPAKLTPMVYASLQLIARSREAGISVLELGRTTGYDQKTCFYVVKQLCDLDLIVKLRRGGNSQNFCVHKYFFDRSPTWKNVREEELRVQEESAEADRNGTDITGAGSLQLPHFDPIDTRHLTSLNILRQRLTKLLKHSLNYTQPYANICVKIGFRPRSRTDRRFFIARLKELINEGAIEKFFMTSQNPDTTQNKQLYIRLAPPDRAGVVTASEKGVKIADDDEDMINNLLTDDGPEQAQVKCTLTLHRQILDALQESGTTGATLSDLCYRLGSLDKRTLELLVLRMERQAPPPHLADLSIVQVLETHGRERRYRIFVLSAYSELVTREGFETPSAPYSLEDLSKAGGFLETHESDFYESRDDLRAFYKKWSGARVHRLSVFDDGGGKAQKGAKRKLTESGTSQSQSTSKKWTNPILPDGTRKRGRPPKNPDAAAAARHGKKAKKDATVPPQSSEATTSDSLNQAATSVSGATLGRGVKRKRGKAEDPGMTTSTSGREADSTIVPSLGSSDKPPKRKRGRPPKQKPSTEVEVKRDERSTTEAPAYPLESTTSFPEEMPPDGIGQGSEATEGAAPLVTGISTPVPENLSHLYPSRESESFLRPQTISDDDRLVSQSDSRAYHPASPGVTDVDTAARLLAVPKPASNDLVGQTGSIDEVTKVIASLAAQINDSISSSPPFNEGEDSAETHLANEPSGKVDGKGKDRGSMIRSDAPIIAEGTGATGLGTVAESSTATHVPSALDNLENTNPSALVSSQKRVKGASSDRERTNLSAMRRENELVQLIENLGGIVNTSTNEFQAAYLDFIEIIVKAGEGASAPVGTRMDKRTLRYSLDKLEASGRIKILNTSIPYVTGGHRSAKIAYLPTVSEERLHAYIAEHRKTGIVVPRRQEQIREQAEKEIEEDPNSPLGLAHRWLYSTNAHEVYQERWHRNVDRAQRLLSHSDDVIREAMLMERQTLSQQYGYLTGKVARARELHLGSIELLERENESFFIISHQRRIVSWQFFENDITLGMYCACVSSSIFREDIRDAVATIEGRNKPVKDIPDEWKQALQIGRARSRERISDLLDYLYSLKLVVPLRRAEHDDSSKVRGSEGSPNSGDFEPLPADWSSRIPVIRPEYWQFCTDTPLYLFALQKDPAPFWKTVQTLSGTEAATFWDELKEVSLNKKRAEEAQHELLASTMLHDPYSGEHRIATALRRSSSWATKYTFSWYQIQYLKQFVDVYTGSTPLDNDDQGASHLERISHVISAPVETVKAYYESSRASVQRDIDRMKQKQENENEEKKEAKMKALLARKGLEAIRSREAAWDAMVERVHPGLVKGVAAGRLRKLRQSYVRGNVVQDTHQWEVQISDAIKAAEKMRSSRNLFSKAQVTREFRKAKFGPHATSTIPGASVELLVDMQKELVNESERDDTSEITANTSRTKRRRDKARKGAEDGRKRRQRFKWSAEYDELLRDAYVILRARCRTHYRLEWTALDQVFPTLLKNSIRARLQVLKEQPGAETYLQRLENCWHDIWIKNRGTPELPDPNPRNPTEFDLKAHLEYLREHVDKNSIRVGVSAVEEKDYTPLPASLEDFVSSWDVEERKAAHDPWDFLTNYAVGEETREKLFLESAFVMESADPPNNGSHSDQLGLAESALKMVIGTPDESYDVNRGAALLHKIGEEEISTAMENLLSRNVFSKTNRDPTRLVPGRTIKISEMNQNALNGPIAKDLFLDASQLEESFEAAKTDQWEWPFTATDGDTAAILQLFSDHKADFEVDTSRAQAARPAIHGNSRKVDDDDIELGVQIKLSGIASCESEQAQVDDEPDSIEVEDASGHGTTVLGEQACCGIRSDRVVDCLKCIEEAQTQLIYFSENDKHIAESIIQHVDARTERGITIEELKDNVVAADGSLASIIHQLHTSRVPRVYVTGYDSTFVVSAKYIGPWTITLPGEDGPLTRVFPRRWLDITGDRISMVWEAGLRAVVGLVHLRPGISQGELRWRLRAVYDRREVIDLLNHLMSSGTLKVFHGGSWQRQKTICIDALTKDEETKVFWAVNEEKRWYRI